MADREHLVIDGHKIDVSFLDDGPLVGASFDLMLEGHAGEVRKIRGEPFVTHPLGVAAIISRYTDLPQEFCQSLSLVHDIIDHEVARERVPVSLLREKLGVDVALGVMSLSKSIKLTDDAARRQEYLVATRGEQDPLIQAVRSADKIHNVQMAIEELQLIGDAFWRHFKGGRRVYVAWPHEVLAEIKSSGALTGHSILDEYENVLEQFDAAINDHDAA